MSTSRRDFLKSTMIAGAGMALPATTSSIAEAQQHAAAGHANAVGTPAAMEIGEFTRGIGMYPGAASENFSPKLVVDNTYRNIALFRPAYHSSSYDYNLTAQLVTDGIKDTHLPRWIGVSTNRLGMMPKTERETLLDHFPTNVIELKGASPSVQVQLGGDDLPAVDRIAAFVTVPERVPASKLSFTISVSDDGRNWKEMGHVATPLPVSPEVFPPDLSHAAQLFFPSIPLHEVCHNRYYEVKCQVAGIEEYEGPSFWGMGQIEFYEGQKRVQIGGPYSFTSAWMSASSGEEWVYVDLGARCEFDRIALYWIARAAEGAIQISDDAKTWHDLHKLTDTGMTDDIKLPAPAHARYLRVLMTRPTSPFGYLLSEIEVYGRGGMIAKPKPVQAEVIDGKLNLAGGNWKLHRLATNSATGETVSKTGFRDSDWMVATVPGTVLTSYVNAGALPDPNFGQNQLHISDSYFYSDFWYRTEFQAPAIPEGQTAWLNFDGINWKADVFLNGEKLGRIEGGFLRGRFDVSGKLIEGKPNALAVKIEKNATPGSAKQKTWESPSKNGGALGADNPTYHASIGWDWIPTIRGRNIGIWGDVYLALTGAVTLENPLVTSKLPLPDTSRADVAIAVEAVNHSAQAVSGTLRGRFGDVRFEQPLNLGASERKTITLDPSTVAALRMSNPQLWWPVGYGEPHLYDVELSFEAQGKTTDKKAFKAGIRQMTYSEEGSALRMWINGRRFVARGGNWGFGESMLLYRSREYDAAVRYHREMNFTMVRNWVGQIGDDAFYEACDRQGVVVWQDFWLANPWDGPIPNDNAMFLNNARDFVSRIRHHASIGLYCGRNEGFPPKPLDDGIRKLLAELHPDMHYIGSSADEVVSGHGPYNALPPSLYFRVADSKLHSEIGMPNIPPIESVRAMMPESAIWPQGLDWGLHDFSMTGAQGGSSFIDIIKDSYGGAQSGEEWITLAQFVNYEGYRAMFESQSKYRMGVLLWMSHPCWPSFVWQTYDYYFEPTAAYFGSKKGSEPLHIQWNRNTESIEVVNYSGGSVKGLTAKAEILNMDGRGKWTKTATLDSAEDSTETPITIEAIAGLSPVHFLRLTLTRGGEAISTNFYLRATVEGDYRAIRQLAKARVHATTNTVRKGDVWMLTTEVENASATPAVMARLKAVRERSGDRILPAVYSDNYFALMPGEKRTITIELRHADTRGEKPKVVVGGFNVESAMVSHA